MDFLAGLILGAIFVGGFFQLDPITIEQGMVACKLQPEKCALEFKIYQEEQALDKLKSTRKRD